MRGRMPAAAVAVTLASLANFALILAPLFALLVTPLFSVLSGATIALVTLRHGAREGLVVSGIAVAAMAALGVLLVGQPTPALFGVALWVPVVALGQVLRVWRSLPLVVEAAVIAGFALVLLQHLVMGDPAVVLAEQMRAFLGQMPQPQGFDEAQIEQMIDLVAPSLAGRLAAGWTLLLVLSMFVARAWQAQLFNPGGFRKEFRGLRLGRWLLYLVPILLIGGVLTGNTGIVAQCSLVGMAGFFFQGVALVHGMVVALQAGAGWLLGFYMVLFFAWPLSYMVVSAAGFADGWLDFRAKVRRNKKRTGDDQ